MTHDKVKNHYGKCSRKVTSVDTRYLLRLEQNTKTIFAHDSIPERHILMILNIILLTGDEHQEQNMYFQIFEAQLETMI